MEIDRIDVGNAVPMRRCQGAMSQQGSGAIHNECTPQQLVRLVGYRDPNGSARNWDRLRATAVEREHAG